MQNAALAVAFNAIRDDINRKSTRNRPRVVDVKGLDDGFLVTIEGPGGQTFQCEFVAIGVGRGR